MKRPILLCLQSCFAVVASAMSVTVVVTQNETCSYMNGTVYAQVDGGVPPYTFLWSTSEVSQGLTGLATGTYSVTVTDFLGEEITAEGTVVSENYPPILDYTHGVCPGQDYYAFFMPNGPMGLALDVSPWTTSYGDPVPVLPPAEQNLRLQMIGVPPGSSVVVDYWDVNGCPGTLNVTTGFPIEWPTYGVLAVEGSCADLNTGSIEYAWTGEPNLQDLFFVLKDATTGNWDTNGYTTGGSPNSMVIGGLAPGDYWLVLRLGLTYSLVQGGVCASPDSVFITVPDLGVGCGQLSVSGYMDYNSDCAPAGEPAVPDAVFEILPGPYYIGGGAGGVVVPYGTYTITSSGPAVAQSCPGGATIDAIDNTASVVIGHQPTIPLDVSIGMGQGPARPGFQWNTTMGVHNLSSSASGITTTTMTFDPAVSYISATPTPNVSGNTLTWTQSSLAPFQDRTYHVQLQIPPDVGLVGTDLLTSATVTTANTDGDPANNTVSNTLTVTGSLDPNDKIAATSTRLSNELYFIDQDEWMDYTIRFQNTGTDTAFNIVVTDTLPATLDPASISIMTASHPFTWSVMGQGVLRLLFPNILLPDSNVNEAASHGVISFRIRPHLPLIAGTVIENLANIFFDFNPPVITQPSVLVAEFSTPVGGSEHPPLKLEVMPNPANDVMRVSLSEGIIENLRLVGMDGRVVLSQASNGNVMTIDVSPLRDGAYLMVAETSDHQEHRLPIVVLHR